jgi:hypothetical protein
MCRLNASLRFDDAVRNLDEAVALQSCSAPVSTGSIEETCLNGDKKELDGNLLGHQPQQGPIDR